MADLVAGGMTFGDDRTGHAEIIRNSKGVDQSALKKAPDPGNPGKVYDFDEGEMVTINADDQADKIGASPEPMAYMVLTGAERTDVRGSKTTAVVVGHGYQAETSKFRLDGTYDAAAYSKGVLLTAEADPADSKGKLRPAASTEPVVAICMGPVKDIRSEAERARGDGFTKVIRVEFGPRGYAP